MHKLSRISKWWQQNIKPSTGPFQVRGLVWLRRSHAHEAWTAEVFCAKGHLFTNRVSVSETQTSWSLMSPDWLNSTSRWQAALSTVYTMQVPGTWVPSKWKGLFSLIILKIYTEDDNLSHAQQYVAGENFKLPSVVLSIFFFPFSKSESSIRLVFAKQGEDTDVSYGNWGKGKIVLQNKLK